MLFGLCSPVVVVGFCCYWLLRWGDGGWFFMYYRNVLLVVQGILGISTPYIWINWIITLLDEFVSTWNHYYQLSYLADCCICLNWLFSHFGLILIIYDFSVYLHVVASQSPQKMPTIQVRIHSLCFDEFVVFFSPSSDLYFLVAAMERQQETSWSHW